MTTQALKTTGILNGIDLDYLSQTFAAIKQDPAKAMTNFRVKSAWQGQTVSETKVESYSFLSARQNVIY